VYEPFRHARSLRRRHDLSPEREVRGGGPPATYAHACLRASLCPTVLKHQSTHEDVRRGMHWAFCASNQDPPKSE
jgi:hypothetical protein